MKQNPNRKGGGYSNQPGSRGGNALSKTDKTVNSADFDEHMSLEDRLRRHRIKQKAHMKAVERRKAGHRVDPCGLKLPDDESKPVPLESEEDDRKVVLEGDYQTVELEEDSRKVVLNRDGRLIVGLRVYEQNADGTPRGKSATSEELLAKHRLIRRERECHIDQDGTHVRVGELTRERKGKYLDKPTFWGPERSRERRVPAVMRSILGRLMPHEGEVSGEELTQDVVEDAMDEAVSEFQKATGCEIISAAAHRMSGHDLHIHIQYTMVVFQRKKLGKYTKERKEWRTIGSAMAREVLREEGVKAPNPSSIGAKKKRLIEAGELVPEPESKVVFRKVKGLRFMGNGSILGHSFRNKLNVVRLAEEAKLPDLANRVIELRDELGGFRPITKRSDKELEGQYLDLWLERMWRRIIKARLSKDALKKVRTEGVTAARNYAKFGAVKPKESDLERLKVDLMYKEAQLGWDTQILEMEEAQRLEEVKKLRGENADMSAAKEKLEKDKERELDDFDKLRVKMLEDYNEVCEDRNLQQLEKGSVVAELSTLRTEHATAKKQLEQRDAKIEVLRQEVSGLHDALNKMRVNLERLVDLVKVFAVKLLGKREILRDVRYDEPLYSAFDAMFQETTGKTGEEFNQIFEAPSKSEPPKDNEPIEPEGP